MNISRHLLRSIAGLLPLLIAGELQAAAFDPSAQPLGAIAPLTLDDTDLAGGAKAYRSWFENGSWQGDLIEYTVDTSGILTTSVDLSGNSPVNTGSPPENWSAHVKFAAAEVVSSTYWNTTRKVITFNGSLQKAFRWPSLSTAQQQALDLNAYDNSATSSDILDFLRGDRSNETPAGAYRARQTVLGDIIHSNPNYVGPPSASFTENDYAGFAALHASRDKRVYVGANDGLLHAFDVDDGSETWAYAPSMLIGELDRLAGRPYSHHYGVDGLLTAQDVFFSGAWHTVLVGGLGAGGKGWYGLDITDPDIGDEAATSGNDIKAMWELESSDDNDLGYSFGQAVIAKLNDGKWYAVMGNGYNSVNGVAMLYIVDIATGTERRLSTSTGTSGSPNGLSSPALVDRDGNGTADIAYAGDIDGDLWKFDLTSTSAASWAVAYSATPLHPGLATQPIIQPPEVTLHPSVGHLVYFGTGRLFTEADRSDTSTQAIYGIWDDGDTPPTSGAQVLFAQTLSGDKDYTATDIAETVQTFNPDPGPIDWSSNDGWKIDLPAGFRLLSPPVLRGGRVKVIINEPIARSNYLLEAAFADGGSPGSAILDLNQSSTLTSADNFDANADSDLDDREDVVVMWQQPAGVMSQLTVARVSNGVDTQFLNYLVPPAPPPCNDDCADGFQGGHIDVDTDYPLDTEEGVGGQTFKHSHEYDKQTGRVYVDYLDHGAANGHVELDDTSYVAGDTEWIVVIANADLSPGSVLMLDDREYNVVEYQVMMHRKLRDWKGGNNPLTDDDGNSLIFSADALASSGGTVRHDFDDMAILAGGLHPSNTSCVNRDTAVTNGRYRNGAQVTQAIDLSLFGNCGSTGCSLDRLIEQNPTDLNHPVVLGDGSQVNMQADFDSSTTFDASNHEIFGGLRADISGFGDTDAVFESTLFWHYGGSSCYGEADWEADVAEVLDELILTQEEFDAILADLEITDLEAELAANESCKGIKENEGGCKNYYRDLEDLVERETTIFVEFDTGEGSGTGLESAGDDPVVMEGAAASTGVTAGPNFEVGRRTWTDVTDE